MRVPPPIQQRPVGRYPFTSQVKAFGGVISLLALKLLKPELLQSLLLYSTFHSHQWELDIGYQYTLPQPLSVHLHRSCRNPIHSNSLTSSSKSYPTPLPKLSRAAWSSLPSGMMPQLAISGLISATESIAFSMTREFRHSYLSRKGRRCGR
jgi:hypothetical protein